MHRRALSAAVANDGRRFLELLALLTMFVASAVIGRGDMLDDAFIHLRYADNLLSRGAFEYNPGEPSYGTSSPLFVLLLAALRWLPVDYQLPKLLSGAAWVLLLASVWRLSASHQNPTRSALVLFAVAVASPFGCRWLASGLETSLVALWSLATALLCAGLLCGRESRGITLSAAGIAATGVLLRIELTVLVAVLILLCAIRAGRTGASLAPVASALCGLGAGLALLWVMFGRILPDTAIAKSGTASLSAAVLDFPETVEVAIAAHVAASFFGIVLMLLVAVSFFRAMLRLRDLQRLIVAGANLI